jgi:hypothetical protein
MSLPQGINFRSSSGFVTDGTNEYGETAQNVSYPTTTPQGNNVGWESFQSGFAIGVRDRDATNDRRLAGVHFSSTGAAYGITYRIDLPASGSYNIRGAFGDESNFDAGVQLELFDGSTSLGVLASNTAVPSGHWLDATGTDRSPDTDWAANNVAVNKTFATSILRFLLGTSTQNAVVAHFYVESGASAPVITAQPTQQSGAVGGTPTFGLAATGATSYQWQSAPITSLYANVPGSWSNVVGATSSTYTLPALASGDNGTWFRCIATNGIGSTTSQPARVFVSGLGVTGKAAVSPFGIDAWMVRAAARFEPDALLRQRLWAGGDSGADWRDLEGLTTPATGSIAPSGIATGAAFGTASVKATAAPTGIASAAAIGTQSIKASVSPTGIATAQALGTASVKAALSPSGLGSAAAFGTDSIGARVAPTGIATTVAIGTASIGARVVATGIATAATFGAPAVGARLSPAGVAGAAAVGSQAVLARVAPVGIASGEALGSPIVSQVTVISVGIPSVAAFGSPSVRAVLAASGIASSSAFGTPVLNGQAPPPSAPTRRFVGGAGLERHAEPAMIAVMQMLACIVATGVLDE